ncbi:hypothetical protein EDB83DRAFT_2515197 [Lactarius deliciosus]|nr:hypothetical protein EDB83DRAFT_2515197 [Lactarius deliciosus]
MLPLLAAVERAIPNSESMRTYGGEVEHLAKIAKDYQHSVDSSYAQFLAEAAVLASPQISNELTEYMCSSTSDHGAACCMVAREAFVHACKLENQAIELVATGITTDFADTFAGRGAMDIPTSEPASESPVSKFGLSPRALPPPLDQKLDLPPRALSPPPDCLLVPPISFSESTLSSLPLPEISTLDSTLAALSPDQSSSLPGSLSQLSRPCELESSTSMSAADVVMLS